MTVMTVLFKYYRMEYAIIWKICDLVKLFFQMLVHKVSNHAIQCVRQIGVLSVTELKSSLVCLKLFPCRETPFIRFWYVINNEDTVT